MPPIDLTDAEHAAVTALIRRAKPWWRRLVG
jgi:hypothetical protein